MSTSAATRGLLHSLGHALPPLVRVLTVAAFYVAQIFINVISSANVGIFDGKGVCLPSGHHKRSA